MTILYHSHESLFARWQGTVLPRAWKLTLFTGVLSYFLCAIYDEHRKMVKRGGNASFSFHLFHDAESFFAMSTTFVTFILGFFNASVFGRWWKLRELTGTVVGRSVDSSLMLTTYMDGEDERSKESVRELVRYLGLALATSLHAARGEATAVSLETLCQKENARGESGRLLEKDGVEYNILLRSKISHFNIVYGWYLKKLKHCHHDGLIDTMPDTVLYMLHTNVQLMRGAAADILMYKNTPIPIAYTHLLEVFVKIYIITAPAALTPGLLWMAPPVVMLVTFFFYGFLTLGRMMLNPFKDEPDSFPTVKFLDDTIDTMVEMVKWVPQGVPYRGKRPAVGIPPAIATISSAKPSPKTPPCISTAPDMPQLDDDLADDDDWLGQAYANGLQTAKEEPDEEGELFTPMLLSADPDASPPPMNALPNAVYQRGAAKKKKGKKGAKFQSPDGIESLRQRPRPSVDEEATESAGTAEWRRASLIDGY